MPSKQVPGKIDVQIQQNAHGFTFSRSAQGRTQFTIQASQAIQFKQGGRVELHNVTITLFGRDSARFDQIYGTDFDYDPQSGDVVSKGEVQIDLQANPEGLSKPDQAPPRELKNPIHLRTTGLIFNQKSGDASTHDKVDFTVPQAKGSALGASYVANTGVLSLQSQVEVRFAGPNDVTLNAVRGTISKNPRIVVLEQPHIEDKAQRAQADQATLYLRQDNTLDRVLAQGSVLVDSTGPPATQVKSEQLELFMAEKGNLLRNAIFSDNVRMETGGPQPLLGYANKAVLTFTGNNVLATAHTEGNVRLLQHPDPSATGKTGSTSAQNIDLTAPVIDFVVADGRRLKNAVTSGPPRLTIQPVGANAGQETLVTAGKFAAQFDDLGQLTSVHGAPEARIVNQAPGQTDRVSTSNTLDASFRPGSGIDVLVQQGDVAYVDGERKAWSEKARYTPADQILTLTGSPRVIDGGMTTTARLHAPQPRHRGRLRRRRREKHLQRSEGSAGRSAACVILANSCHLPRNDGPSQQRSCPLHRQCPSLAGRKHRRGSVDRV